MSESNTMLRILLSDASLRANGAAIDAAIDAAPNAAPNAALGARAWMPVLAPALDDARIVDADIAFVSRDVTGLSTKHEILPVTQRFYSAMLEAPSLRWVHTHSAGADRRVFG